MKAVMMRMRQMVHYLCTNLNRQYNHWTNKTQLPRLQRYVKIGKVLFSHIVLINVCIICIRMSLNCYHNFLVMVHTIAIDDLLKLDLEIKPLTNKKNNINKTCKNCFG